LISNTADWPDAAVTGGKGSYPQARLENTVQANLGTSKDSLARLKQLADELIEDGMHRDIRGNGLPKQESLRGPRVTTNAVRAEIDRWRNHPILSKYVPTLGENQELHDILEKVEVG